MRTKAKALFGTTGRVIERGRRIAAFAPRAASAGPDGSSAPSRRPRARLIRLGVALAVAALSVLFAASLAQASKVVIKAYSSSGQEGGQFGTPRGIAINETGAGGVAAGTLYVVDSQSRVQRLSPTGDFERLWGQDVIGINEQQQVTIDATGGTYTLTFDGETTGPIDFNAGSFTVQTALRALSTIGSPNVSVSGPAGGPYTVTFTNALAATDVSEMTADSSGLTGGASTATVTTLVDGFGGVANTGFEICTIAAQCKSGITSDTTANGGQLANPQGVAVNQANGDVYVTESTNRRVSEFDADGNFVRAWGWDVVSTGGTGDVSTNDFEICTVIADCKRAASAGGDGGRFGNLGYPITDAANDVWVADAQNRRIQRFQPNGAFVAAYGYDVDAIGGGGALESCTSTTPGDCQAAPSGSGNGQFGNNSPTRLAFDSDGFLLAVDNSNNRVQRFDPSLTSVFTFGAGALSGSPSPTDVADVPGSENVYVVKPCNATICPGAEFSFERRILELDPGGNVVDTHLANDGVTSVNGMAVNSTTGDIHLTTTTGGFRLLMLGDPIGAPAATMNPVTTFDATSATFSGTVNPNDGQVACRFEYSTDESSWTSVPEDECDSLTGNTPQPVSEGVTGLEPNTHYFVRLVAFRPLVAGTVESNVVEFTTDPLAPTISGVGAVQISDTSARLVAQINAHSDPTTYQFHYGTTTAYGSTTPPASAGSGADPVVVSRVISGLDPNTTYHFKVVATNSAGPSESGDNTFTTRAEPLPLPDGRAYEQVTPADKNYGDALAGLLNGANGAATGEAAAFCTAAQFLDAPGALCAPYVSARDGAAQIWETQPALTNYCSTDFDDPDFNFSLIFQSLLGSTSADMSRAVILLPEGGGGCPIDPLDPAAPTPSMNLYRRDFVQPPSFDLLAPAPGVPGAFTSDLFEPAGTYTAGSDDLSHVVYTSEGQQTVDAPVGTFNKLFEWEGGTVSLVSRDTSDTPFATASTGISDRFNGTSADGSRIFFVNGPQIYMRENGTTTHLVSESECTVDCGSPSAETFRVATPDGSKALMTSNEKLTDDDVSGTDLFLYTHSATPATDTNLTLLSQDNEPGDGTNANVQGVLEASADGETVYFVANGQIVAGEPTAGGPKLYRWQNGVVTYLATLAGGDSAQWGTNVNQNVDRQVTPDGSQLAIRTSVALDPIADQDSDVDVYHWGEQGGWSCASCQDPGVPSTGASTITGPSTVNQEQRRAISNDGKVFFTTADALVSQDTNGAKDVYEWNDGTISLISSGLAEDGAEWIGSSADGEDVFFITRQQLVGWDVDHNEDIYDARVGGGFPEPPAEFVCQGDDCQGPPSAAPSEPSVGSSTYVGPGNVRQAAPRNCGRFFRSAKRLRRRARALTRRAARTSGARAKLLRAGARKARLKARRASARGSRCQRRAQ